MYNKISNNRITSMYTYLAICLLIGSVCGGKQDYPSYIKQCKRGEDVSQCVRDNIELIKPHMTKAIPKLGMPQLDPLLLPQVGIESANFNLDCQDFSITGLKDLELKDTKVDLEKGLFEFDFSLPFAEINSKYKVNGKILVLQLDGSGPLFLNITDIHFNCKFSGEPVERDGKTYIEIDKSDIKLIGVKDAHVQLGNLFASNEELTKSTNDVFNENIQSILDELRPLFEKSIGEVLRNILKNFFQKHPTDKLLV